MSRFAIAAALLLAATAAWPQTVSTTPATPAPDVTFDCYRGTSIILRDAASLQACVDASKADTLTRKASASYTARTSAGWSTTYTAPTPTCGTIGQPTTRTQACPSGTTGSYVQTSTPTPAPYPTCSTVGPWLPASPPAGACTPVVVTPPPPVAELPVVNTAAIPRGDPGDGRRLINQTGEQPYRDPDGNGAFRTVCLFSHMNFDDPLVYPGGPGRSHLHTFFGNTLADASSTAESIRTTGNSTCRGGIVNRSAYWVPAVIDTRTGTPQAPTYADIYYKTTVDYAMYGTDAKVQPFPVGLRMIAGDSKSRSPQAKTFFECNGSRITDMSCSSGTLTQVVLFPQCWDRVNLDSPDHKSHMAYGANGVCPATHPVQLPQIGILAHYNVPSGGTSAWRLSSDISGTPAGSSGHGDWMNGWEEAISQLWVTQVINRGLSGGSHIVGGGWTISYPR